MAFDDAKALDREGGKRSTSGWSVITGSAIDGSGRTQNASDTSKVFYGLTPAVTTEQSKGGEVALSYSKNGSANQTPSVQIVLPASNEVALQTDNFALADTDNSKRTRSEINGQGIFPGRSSSAAGRFQASYRIRQTLALG